MSIVLIIFILGLLTPRLAGRLAIPVEKLAKYVFYGAVILIFGIQGYWGWQQYLLWKYGGPPAVYLLPPHQPISYFYLYAYMQFFNKFVISCLAAFLILFASKILNHYFKNRFFEKEEPYFAALTVFLLGQPLWLFYAPVVLGAGLIKSILGHRKSLWTCDVPILRFSLYYLWIPAGILLFLADLAFKFSGYL